MSDAPKPLFPPPRQEEPPPPPPNRPPPSPPIDIELAGKIERAVSGVFTERFGGQAIPYGQARVLVTLEVELIGQLVRLLATGPK